MARKHETVLRRIARHLPGIDTEENLRAFLASGSDDHLFWQGQFKPKAFREAYHKVLPALTKYGFDRKVYRSPKKPAPYLSSEQTNPVRLLFCDDLDPLVRLHNTCGHLDCINPLHYEARSTFSVKEGRKGELPE